MLVICEYSTTLKMSVFLNNQTHLYYYNIKPLLFPTYNIHLCDLWVGKEITAFLTVAYNMVVFNISIESK